MVLPTREFKKPTTATTTGAALNKNLISRTVAAHVRYNSWCISLPSSAKRHREMTKFCSALSGECEPSTTDNFSNFHVKSRTDSVIPRDS